MNKWEARLHTVHKGLRYLLLLPQAIIDIRSLLLFIGVIIHVPLVGDAEDTASWLLMVEVLLAVPVIIGVNHHFYKDGPIYDQGRWDSEPKIVLERHLTAYLHSHLSKRAKCVRYVTLGFQAIILIALAISSHTNIISLVQNQDNMVIEWFVAWVFFDFFIWTDLYSYIRSKNDETPQ